MRDESGASTYAATEEQATLTAAMTATLPAIEPGDELRGRVCLVTGASRGLGKETALGLARLGARVLLHARDERLGAAAAEDIAQRSGNSDISVVIADLASFADIRSAATQLRETHSVLHVLVHNAGVNIARRKVSADGIELTLAVNHLAPFLLTHELLPLLRRGGEQGGARVVTVASMFERFGRIAWADPQGERRWVGPLAYAQSKLANVAFTYELAARLAGTGITANCVDPGLVATDLTDEMSPEWKATTISRIPAGRLGQPEEIARATAFLVSEDASYIFGETLSVNGGSYMD